eukprot:1195840-Prorocentrum_minimum.AAC.7
MVSDCLDQGRKRTNRFAPVTLPVAPTGGSPSIKKPYRLPIKIIVNLGAAIKITKPCRKQIISILTCWHSPPCGGVRFGTRSCADRPTQRANTWFGTFSQSLCSSRCNGWNSCQTHDMHFNYPGFNLRTQELGSRQGLFRVCGDRETANKGSSVKQLPRSDIGMVDTLGSFGNT